MLRKKNPHPTAHLHAPRRRRWLTVVSIVVPVALVVGGLYLLLVALAPTKAVPLPGMDWQPPAVNHSTVAENRLYIPRISVNIAYEAGTKAVLDHKAWHRYPERGDPEKGGNFILAAHRFQLGFLPGETKRKSPFYKLNQLESGDLVYVDFNGTRYKYQVTTRYRVEPTAVQIEDATTEHKITLYSCTLKGEKDGREVVEAVLVEKNVDVTQHFEDRI